MQQKPIYAGNARLNFHTKHVEGDYMTFEGEAWYRIRNYDQMKPFFMTIVSDSDHWLFVSSNGALTAGRRNPENALFPYYTDDKIHDSADITGSKTIIIVEQHDKRLLWEPFSDGYSGMYPIRRNLYKSRFGNQILFEEENKDLGLVFSYRWAFSEKFGFVRKAFLQNTGNKKRDIRLLDGIQNILPYGVDLAMQTERSTLLDAYKKNELDKASGIGIYSLSSIPIDKAEPSESLKATTVWCAGLDGQVLLTSLQHDTFRKGEQITEEHDIRAERGAYFVHTACSLDAGHSKTWFIVSELEQDAADIEILIHKLQDQRATIKKLEEDISKGTSNLAKMIAASDGFQISGDQAVCHRHLINVLFNIMRGGVFADSYNISTPDLVNFISAANQNVYNQHQVFFSDLPDSLSYASLIQSGSKENAPDLERLCYEYLPLTFSRRHGDPSRPWNNFSIEVKNPAGDKKLSYAGNWRDIFQNWEALAFSYPEYIESMICKFVNASTPDGYNPYRITRDGIDWEVSDPDDPWSYIGYWGDHQIIYLLKFLELSSKFNPGKLQALLTRPIFAYANVPYRIKPYEKLLEDPQDTVEFDYALEKLIEERVQNTGSDGKLVWDEKEQVYLTNLTEKLLLALLAKCSNLVPEGGIWLNTQRPEWNDANNALVGNGLSMVTLYYMRRYVTFCQNLLSDPDLSNISISAELAEFLRSVATTFQTYRTLLNGPFPDTRRKKVLDSLGHAGTRYRQQVYHGFGGLNHEITTGEIREFLDLTISWIDHSIKANKRKDKLYHAYNLQEMHNSQEISVEHLYEMLEGQVAVLSSGYLKNEEVIELLESLAQSDLYRPDQKSYLLYPDRSLPRFRVKNVIPEQDVKRSELLVQLIADGKTALVERDTQGNYHFNGAFTNAGSVEDALHSLSKTEYKDLVEKERDLVLEIFERVFDHKSFTGRSGTFFGYEGLGCIYWHMVSKLLLAVEECCLKAIEEGAEPAVIEKMNRLYYDIRSGIGFNKTPEEYGAFPSDAYSHTPGNAGAQQPGMTGQVKEDILSRFGELGVRIEQGTIQFKADLLRESEFLIEPSHFDYYDVTGQKQSVTVPADALAFTYCQVPVIYHLSKEPRIILFKSGHQYELDGLVIDKENSKHIFNRDGVISRIDVRLQAGLGDLNV